MLSPLDTPEQSPIGKGKGKKVTMNFGSEEEKDETIDESFEQDRVEFHPCLAFWSLFLVSFTNVNNALARSLLSPFFGYTNVDHLDDKKYEMPLDVGITDAEYRNYNSFYTFSMIPSMLLIGPFASKWNRKWTASITLCIWSLALAAHGLVTEAWQLYPLIVIIGIMQGISSALPYTMTPLYFPET